MNNNKRLVSTFFKTLLLSMSVCVLITIVAYIGYLNFAKGTGDGSIRPGLKKGGNVLSDMFEPVPERINFLVLGTDQDGTRTDMVLVGSFLTKDGFLSLVSIPRDTLVTIPKDRLDAIKTYNSGVPANGNVKLCEVHHHAGPDNGIDFTVQQIEELLEIDLEYYIEVNFEALHYIVDAIDGVEFEVPQRMYYYDPTQNLLIDLQPGVQVLDGQKAEQLVRFRSYKRGDLQRVEVQQQFIKTMMMQMLSSENIIKTLPAIVNAGMKHVKTNFNVTEITKYLKYVKRLTTERIATYTLPSIREKINGKEFQILDEQGTREVLQKVFYTQADMEQQEKTSVNQSIQVLNGGYTSGLALKTKERLEAGGFTVSAIADYNGEKQAATRVIVKKDGQGKDLLSYFTDAEIEVDPGISADYDIVIILGTREK